MSFLFRSKKPEGAVAEKEQAAEPVSASAKLKSQSDQIVPHNGCRVEMRVDWENCGVSNGERGVIRSLETNGFYVDYPENSRIIFHPSWHWGVFVVPAPDDDGLKGGVDSVFKAHALAAGRE